MDIVANFIEYLLDNGMLFAAVIVAAAALALWAFLQWRVRDRHPEPTPQATIGESGQITQVSDVRAKGDVNVSPEQRRG